MQNIAVADHLLESVENGGKKFAIRFGHCSIAPGPLEVKSASGFWGSVKVTVERVDKKIVSELTTEQLNKCGYVDLDGLLEVQRACYPCINALSEVTIISWR